MTEVTDELPGHLIARLHASQPPTEDELEAWWTDPWADGPDALTVLRLVVEVRRLRANLSDK